jgi:hypothetical protein
MKNANGMEKTEQTITNSNESEEVLNSFSKKSTTKKATNNAGPEMMAPSFCIGVKSFSIIIVFG